MTGCALVEFDDVEVTAGAEPGGDVAVVTWSAPSASGDSIRKMANRLTR
ncbi:hypothetical protein [Marisediminicola sp. LYQ134]